MAASTKKLVTATLTNFLELTKKPEDYLSTQKTYSRKFKTTAKNIYDFSKTNELKSDASNTLPELIVDNFDEEQVWQELELQNEFTVNKLLSQVANIVSSKSNILFTDSDKSESSLRKSKDGKAILKHTSKIVDGSGKGKISKHNNLDIEDNDESENDDDSENNLESESNDESGASEKDSDNTDDELSQIKSRLKTDGGENVDSDDNSDLDFDFGDLGHDIENDDLDEDIEDKTVHKTVGIKTSLKSNDDDEIENTEIKRFKDSLKKNRKGGSIVDDKFFKLSALETFLDQEDAREERRRKREEKIQKGGKADEESSSDDEEEIDMFGDLPSDEDSDEEDNVKSTRDFTYEDFFDPPEEDENDGTQKNKKVRFKTNLKDNDISHSDSDDIEADTKDQKLRRNLLEDSDSEGEDVAEILGRKTEEKSTFEKRQEKLKKKIAEMEEASLKEKPWQLSGEASSSVRPENSLLEEHVMFEHTTRLPPVITEETTKTLEDIIKQRVKDKVWDDVERKVKPKEDPFEYKKRIVLDQEKSKQSLGEIYEQEYLKQQQKDEEEKEDPAREEIKKMMQSLFVKLDALSNFNYTPKQAAPDIKIVSNLPSIAMEEVAPVSVSDNKLLAPEEVQRKVEGELKGKTEKSTTDKKRERKKKKMEKRKKGKEKEKRQKMIEKMKPGSGNKNSKENALKQMEKQSKSNKGGVTVIKDDKKTKTSLTSSKSFFTQLQEEVTTQIKSKKSLKRTADKSNRTSSKKLKL